MMMVGPKLPKHIMVKERVWCGWAFTPHMDDVGGHIHLEKIISATVI